MLKMSSSSSTMIIPTPPRIMCTVLDARPAVLTKALLTPSSHRATCGRLETLLGCWKRPGRPSTPNCVSSWTPAEGEEAAVRHTAVHGGSRNDGDSGSYFPLLATGGRMRYRGSNFNNPNLMYRDECDRRMRPGGGSKDGHDTRNSRDEDRPSSSYRDQSRDHRNSYASGSDQYQSYNSTSGGYNSHSEGGSQDQPRQAHSQFGQALLPPLPAGLQPLMAQQYAPQQPPLMGFVGQTPYPFASPPPPPPGIQPPRK